MPVDIRLTYEDYCLLPNDGKRYEIIDGELFVTPAPNFAHQRMVTRITRYLSAFVEDNGLGEVFVSPFDVVFSQFDVVEPDILYISKARSSVLTERNVQGAPDLVIEVLSPKYCEDRPHNETEAICSLRREGILDFRSQSPFSRDLQTRAGRS